jgi:hypothetical protein
MRCAKTARFGRGVTIGTGSSATATLSRLRQRRCNSQIVSGIRDAKAIAGGTAAGYALRQGGEVEAWGGNFDGALGDGTLTSRATLAQVLALTGVTAIGAGPQASAAYALTGQVP